MISLSRAAKSPTAGRWRIRAPSCSPLRCSSTRTAGAPSQRPRHETPSTFTRSAPPNSLATAWSPLKHSAHPQVAGLIAADANHHVRRRLEAEVGEEADELVQPVQRHAELGREILDLLRRQISAPFLDRTQWLGEHLGFVDSTW